MYAHVAQLEEAPVSKAVKYRFESDGEHQSKALKGYVLILEHGTYLSRGLVRSSVVAARRRRSLKGRVQVPDVAFKSCNLNQ